MPSRREILRTGAILPVALALASSPARTALGLTTRPCIGVFDVRFRHWTDFHQVIAARLDQLHRIRGDVTGLWLNHLSQRETTRNAVLIGLTTEPSLFCLELMLRDHGMRVVHREDHDALPSGPIVKDAAHPTAYVFQHSHYTVAARASAMAADRAALDWRPVAARPGPALRDKSGSSASLVSWVICAPRIQHRADTQA